DREGFLRAVEAAVAGEEERVDRHYRIRHASGDWIWIWHRGLVVRDRRGRPVKLTGAFLDVTGQKCAEGALQARTRELEIVLDTVPAGVWFSYDPQVRRVARNRYAATLTGAPDPVSPGPDDAADQTLFLRDGRPAPRDQLPLQRALRGDELVGEEYALRVPGGPDRILLISARALRDEADAIVGAVSIAVDITERKRADEERRLLVNELNHRVKNTLAIVQSLAAQTLRGHEVEHAAAKAFTDRIANLARAHDLLTRESWEGVSLDDLVRQLAEPYDPGDRRRIAASGPPVRLEPRVALALAMALHELATNAAKYGSLSRDGGGVAVAWAATREGGTGRPTLRLRWAERGGPPVEPPRRRGFGTRLLERVLATEPGGGVTTTFAPDGLVCEIRLELADVGGVAAPVESP
ncbi:MAG TPA: HWE histidine kinase domain-containing protein, partial [Salinarimonas sp.]|nr:HWE histidine kinase domain-containing protein [Salinarimonas sp.]